ncbi:MAG: molybdenum ABC transporter ATP-binding protein [Rhodobacteraceae bacterium]|nr:molybdenum ABC transporter ATP-binding protein [Paracoccaceae bacterium]
MTLFVDLKHRLPDFNLATRFEAPPGVTALFGRSGSGKTTIVNAVAGLSRPDVGHIALAGDVWLDTTRNLARPAHQRPVGYVFQDARLFPHMNVLRNLTYSRRRAVPGMPQPGFDDVVDLLGLGSLLDRHPGALSGGERQRVAIGRALLSAPKLLLMDEPLVALDTQRKAEILPYLDQLRGATDLPVLYVSHALSEVARLATTLVLIEQGRVIASGPVERLLSEPGLVRHLGLREAGAILTAKVTEHHADGLTELAVSGGQVFVPTMSTPIGARTQVRVLAQDVVLSRNKPEHLSALNILPATITGLRDGSGPGVIVQLSCGGDMMLARVTRRSACALGLAPGVSVFAVIKAVSIAPADVGGN